MSGEIKLLLGATLFALIPVGVKWGAAVSIYTLLFGRLAIATLSLFLLERDKQSIFKRSYKELALLFVWSVLMLGAMVCYFQSIRISSMSVASALLGTHPVMMVFLGAAMMRESISKRSLFAAVLTFIGIACTVQFYEIANWSYLYGELLAILAAFLLSLNFLVKKKYLSEIKANTLTFFQCLFQLPLLLPFLFWETGNFGYEVLGAMFLLGIVCTTLAYNLIFSGIKSVSAQKIGILQSVEYVLPLIIGVLFFGEDPGLWSIVGIILILLACLMSV